jgi:hypothetical protein
MNGQKLIIGVFEAKVITTYSRDEYVVLARPWLAWLYFCLFIWLFSDAVDGAVVCETMPCSNSDEARVVLCTIGGFGFLTAALYHLIGWSRARLRKWSGRNG